MAALTDVFYGLCTFWTDDWDSLRATGSQIPCCPHCGAVGFEKDKQEWWREIHLHETNGHPGYAAMMEWTRGKCFPNYTILATEYQRALGERG